MLPSEDVKSKGIASREEHALLCGVNKKTQAGNEVIQGSILLPNASAEEEVLLSCMMSNSHAARTDECLYPFCTGEH